MAIRTILVNLDIDLPSSSLLAAANDLARRLDAKLTGFAAAQPPAPEVPIAAGAVAPSWYETNRRELETRIETLQSEFEAIVPPNLRGSFISYIDPPTPSLVAAASGVDLIMLTGRTGGGTNPARHVDVGELLLGAGRPVLLAAAGVKRIEADKIMIGWKDTREARRAVSDALPLLQQAKDVLVATISEGDRAVERARIENVIAWLAMHRVKAVGEVFQPGTAAATLAELGRLQKADLVVSGGYGHSRVREWFFGGVTRDLLAEATINRLMSN